MIILKGGFLLKAFLTVILALVVLLILTVILHNIKRNKLKALLINQRKFLYAYIRLEEKLVSELKNKTGNEHNIKTLKQKYRKEVLSEYNGLFDLQFPKGTHVENIESHIRKEINQLND
ncbi:MAG: hypothetical protein LAT76_00125 [Schleiferiaceae bacterium]|nr:hypothetical protein [Schleiferiaceae bacterium]